VQPDKVYRLTVLGYSTLVTCVFAWAVFAKGASPWWWVLGVFLMVWHRLAQKEK
jgi:hypothetical protein